MPRNPTPTGRGDTPRRPTAQRDTARRDTTKRDTVRSGTTRRPSRALALELLLARWADRAAWLLEGPLRAARTDTGKRALTVAAAVLALAATVRVLYASAEPPASLPDTPVSAADPAAGAADEPEPEGEAEPPAGTVPPNKPVKPTSEEAAVAFYAAELGLPEDQVRALMQQRINDNSVNVLVLAERSAEDLPTRLIQVNRTQSGWRVP